LEKGNLSEQKKILAGKNSLSKKGFPFKIYISVIKIFENEGNIFCKNLTVTFFKLQPPKKN
jgi:hypothetical protein